MLDLCRQHGFYPKPVEDCEEIPLTLAGSDSGSDFRVFSAPLPCSLDSSMVLQHPLFCFSCFGCKRRKTVKPKHQRDCPGEGDMFILVGFAIFQIPLWPLSLSTFLSLFFFPLSQY